MKKDINEIIEKGLKIHHKIEILNKEIMSSEDIPKQLKDELTKLKEEFEQQKNCDDKYIEDNKHRKIIGYTEKYMPIYEDEKQYWL